jgi:hypothetical protein
MLVVPALERQRQRQEGHEFEDSLACMMWPCLWKLKQAKCPQTK